MSYFNNSLHPQFITDSNFSLNSSNIMDENGKNWDCSSRIIKEEADEENDFYTPDQKDILKTYFVNPVSQNDETNNNLKISRIKLKNINNNKSKELKNINLKKLKLKIDPEISNKLIKSNFGKVKNLKKLNISPMNCDNNSKPFSEKYIKRSSSILKSKKRNNQKILDSNLSASKNKTVDGCFSVNDNLLIKFQKNIKKNYSNDSKIRKLSKFSNNDNYIQNHSKESIKNKVKKHLLAYVERRSPENIKISKKKELKDDINIVTPNINNFISASDSFAQSKGDKTAIYFSDKNL